MNTDYRTPTSFYNDTRTARLQRRLGDSGIAALTFLWCFTALYKAEGILTDMDEEDIEFAAKWHGKKGKLVPTLLELRYLVRMQDGTYAVYEWAENNPWAADADNRSDKSRLSSMAKNYPELYEQLTAQGYTGIDRASYARITAEYSKKSIMRSSSKKQRIASESLAPAPAPAPAPVPVPEPTPTTPPVAAQPTPTESTATAQESSSSQRIEKQTRPQKKTEKTQPEADKPAKPTEPAESKQLTLPLEDSDKPEEQSEPEATLEWLFQQWNQQLGSLGFQKVAKVTPRRKGAFKARLRVSQERSSRAWWIALFDKIAASDFMRESAAQKANWLTIDWPLNETNLVKILEGKYDNDRPRKARIHSNDGTTVHAKPQPTTIRRLTHEEISGPELYKWEVEHGYDAAGRKKSTVIEAEAENPVSDTTIPALSASYSEDSSSAEETGYTPEEIAEFYEALDEEDDGETTTVEDASLDEDLTLYGNSGLPTIRRIKTGVF
jgi:hypothetical protein